MSYLKTISHRRLITLAASSVLALAPAFASAEVDDAALPDLGMTTMVTDMTSPGRVSLTVDFVIMLNIGEDIGTILIGNSAIADATLTDGRMIVLKGVGQGVTNLIVLDTAGAKCAEFVVQVLDRKPGTVTVRRAMDVEAYSCLLGVCESDGTAGPALLPAASVSAPH